jgi:ParB/RepB/Spo0J family partition protein
VDIESLTPHPANPRLVERTDVIEAIEAQIKASGYDASHAILIRPLNGGYQIVSGHNRTTAARRAGLKQIPAWVREMDDETACIELVLCNLQADLSPLERGIHALRAIGKHGDIKAYAKKTHRNWATVQCEIQAARVAVKAEKKGQPFFPGLLNCTYHLREIHTAPEHCWAILVKRLIDNAWSVEQTKAAVKTVLAAKPPRGYEKLFPLEQLQELAASGNGDLSEITSLSIRAIERARADIRDIQFAVEDHAAQFEAWLIENGAWDHEAIVTKAQEITKKQRALRHESEAKAAKIKRAITLAEWKTLTAAEREAALRVANPKAALIKQDKDNDSIEWAKHCWNPITGCNHDCPYCYARDLANRFYPQKFEPSLVPDALSAPLNFMPPAEAATNVSYKNIFTCSMADLFGNWVPKEWINRVLEIARQAKQWNFLMLTKFPQRLTEFEFPDNVWVGTTVDCQARVPAAERAMRQVKATVKWVSIEPMIELIEMDFSIFQWVVIGGASPSSQTPEWKPPRRWVAEVSVRAWQAGCKVYYKTNLNLERPREFPGCDEQEPAAAPSPFHYLGKSLPVL